MVNRILSGWSRLLTPVLVLVLAFSVQRQALAQEDEASLTPESGPVNVLVELQQAPAAVIYGNVLRQNAGLDRAQAQALAVAASRAQLKTIAAEQQRFDAGFASAAVPAKEIYRVQKAYNGVAFQVDPAQIPVLRRLPGVKAVHVIVPEFPTNSTSVPFLGVPNIWGNTLGLPQGVTGTGMRIGIIDTGIDYQHANFGGTGLLTDYQANDRTVVTDTIGGNPIFPTAKVVGGTDFVGDAYNGTNTPVPDPDPMDCFGHGSHVAGTAAGFGVTAAGATYTGPYDGSAPFATFRIGPGVAPGASLYALRVFGCTGSTSVTVQAIDWSVDPNGDNDFSDHLDVINMSLGSNFGSVNNTTTQAAENAAAAGVIVVCSAGNAGDAYFITGAPGVSSRTISTAAIADSGLGGVVLNINSPPAIAGGYAASASNSFAPTPAPNPSGQTASVVQAVPADGCSALTNAAAVAGNIVLVDRGTCGFQVKANNGQAAGAIGVIIANNVPGDPNLIAMGATGSTPVTIPTVFISQADRNKIVASLPGVNATLAAATAADTIASFSSRGPRRASSPVRLKPDIAAPGVLITSTQTGVCNSTCLRDATTPNGAFIPGNLSLTISGTSMASPHMAGVMALLRQLHPDWTVEELKSLAMNNALHDTTLGSNGAGLRYGPSRIGAGRVDPSLSATATVLAFNAEDPGLVSVSFETEVVGSVTRTKKIRVVNTGATSQTYDLSIDTRLDAPGVAFGLPGGSSVTVPAGSSTEIDVQMTADATQMDHVREPTLAPTSSVASPASIANLAIPRQWISEEAGYVIFSQAGSPKLRVPVYVAPRPASTMSGPATIVTGGAGSGSTTIPLSGSDVCTGTLSAGPACTGSFPTDVVSLVSPFELQVVSPLNPSVAPATDLQYAGVATDGSRIWFGLSTWGDWSSPTDVSFTIYIDNNLDGVYDRQIFNTNSGGLARQIFGQTTQNDLDTFIASVFTPPGTFSNVIAASTPNFVNRLDASVVDTAIFNNNVMFFGATPAQLGLASTNSPFRYKIETCPGFAVLCQTNSGFHNDEAVGPFQWSGGAPGLSFGNATLTPDLSGASLPVTWNTANLTANGSLGALLLHHHNAAGRRAQVVLLQGTPSADLGVTLGMSPATPSIGQNVTFTVTVTNNGPSAATGVVVSDHLPAGLTYVSDDGGGAYNSTLGLWTVGSLAVSGSSVLHIVATVDTSSPVHDDAMITSGTPLDPNPANNQAAVDVLAPHSADLALAMSVSSPTVLVGGSVTYTLTVTNDGDDPAYGLDVTEAFPSFPLLNPTSSTVTRGVFNPATGLWNLANLAKGATATLTLTVTAPNIAGALTNNGSATGGDADPNTANNAASATTTVLSPATVTATKSVAGSFVEGGAITYTVVLANSSAFDQQDNPGHEFTDVLPAQLTLASASATSGTAVATVGTNTVTWDGVVPANGSVTLTIHATIKTGTALQTVTNQGTANFDADGNGVNEATASTSNPGSGGATSFVVVSPSSIGTHSKTVAGTFAEGGSVTYTVTISNPSANTQLDNPGDEFTDVLPAGLTLVGASATSGTATPDVPNNTVHWNGSIAAGGSVTITITALINNGTAGTTISNQGTIFFDADGNGTNESSILTDDPNVGGANDPTSFVVASIAQVPTLSTVGLALLALLLVGGALLALRRRQA